MIFNGYLAIEKWVTEPREDLVESTVASIFATFSTVVNADPADPCYGIRVTAGAYEAEHLVASTTPTARPLPSGHRLSKSSGR
jgi:hypothetical protein